MFGVTVFARGGKRQSKAWQYKDKASSKIATFMERKSVKKGRDIIIQMYLLSAEIDRMIAEIKLKHRRST